MGQVLELQIDDSYNQMPTERTKQARTWITLYMHPFEPPEKEANTVGNGFIFSS
jgi:hypothetical protein